jgi:hypothetical protein
MEPNLKEKAECQGNRDKCKVDGCPKFGTLGKTGRAKGCGDPAAMGARNRRGGLKKQRDARKALGIPNAKNASTLSNEENWSWHFRVEVKSGLQVSALTTRFLDAEQQAEASRAIGDSRGFVFIAMPKDMTDGLITMRLSSWQQTIAPLLEGA